MLSDVILCFKRIVELGFTDIGRTGRILLTGAMVVVPVWLALRLLDSTSSR